MILSNLFDSFFRPQGVTKYRKAPTTNFKKRAKNNNNTPQQNQQQNDDNDDDNDDNNDDGSVQHEDNDDGSVHHEDFTWVDYSDNDSEIDTLNDDDEGI